MGDKVLTIGDLVGTASLDTTVLAGRAGLEREVLWAHSCEMPDPERWLGPHELLMTVGLCVPPDAPGQVTLIARLDDAGLSGMMIGDHEPAPVLSAEMLAEAEARGFPVLLAGRTIPYAVIARHVAAANSSAQTLQVLKLSKLYHLAAYADDDNDSLVSGLSSLLGVGIDVIDDATRLPLFTGRPPAHERLRAQANTRRYRLNGRYDATLQLQEFDGEELDGFLLVHLMKVLEVVVDRILTAASGRARMSAGTMLALLNGAHHPDSMAALAPHLPSDGFHVVAFELADGSAISRLASVKNFPVIVGSNRTNQLALVPSAFLDSFEQWAFPMAERAGVSSMFVDLSDTRVAAGEAARVLATGRHTPEAWSRFEGVAVSVLSRSHREAEQIVSGVLGPLVEGGARTEVLRETLFVYLQNDRKWTETAAALGIHRQTLSYRLRRIEEETGLDLTKVSDISAAWIACQAWGLTHSPSDSSVAR